MSDKGLDIKDLEGLYKNGKPVTSKDIVPDEERKKKFRKIRNFIKQNTKKNKPS